MKLKPCESTKAPKKRSTQNRNKILIAFPHIKSRSDIPAPYTIFGRKAADLTYITSDEMWSNRETSIIAAQTANNSDAPVRTQRWHEAYLSAYLNRAINLQHIIVGFNSDGRSYRKYGYRPKGAIKRNQVHQKVMAVISDIPEATE